MHVAVSPVIHSGRGWLMWDQRPRALDFDDDEFGELDSWRSRLEFLLRYAVLAPSTHNSQPWAFSIASDGVGVHADETRSLRIADAEQRELFMSLGAAIANLRVAAAHFGFDSTVEFRGNGEAAFVSLRNTSAPDGKLASLFAAIRQRRTSRHSFSREPIAPEPLALVLDRIEEEPETFSIVFSHNQARMADLVALADKVQAQDERYRAELAAWTRGSSSHANDGLNAESSGFPSALSNAAPLILHHGDFGALQAYRDHDLAESAACLIVVSHFDDPPALIRAGESLEMLLLVITQAGLQYSFLNAPVQVPALRDRVALVARTERPPQLLLRLGQGAPVSQPTARRPLDEVVRS